MQTAFGKKLRRQMLRIEVAALWLPVCVGLLAAAASWWWTYGWTLAGHRHFPLGALIVCFGVMGLIFLFDLFGEKRREKELKEMVTSNPELVREAINADADLHYQLWREELLPEGIWKQT